MLQLKRRQGLGNGRPVLGKGLKVIGAIVVGLWSGAHVYAAPTSQSALADVIMSEHRSEAAARDMFRNPEATLAFFQVEPHHTVVEVWPGGGWYTEILAPYVKDNGVLYAAHFSADSSIKYFSKSRLNFDKKLQSSPMYSDVRVSVLEPGLELKPAPTNSADRVLTFRNVHNWMRNDQQSAMFKSFYDALKPNGLLGVVEHRAKPNTDWETMVKSGYVTEAAVIAMAESAGFEWVASSTVNHNPRDTADHPNGVWTLPPRLALGEKNRAKYLQIGESDRMTLLFKKPSK